MIFKDNFTETNLLFSQPVRFTIYEDEEHQLIPLYEFDMQMPTVRHFYFNNDLRSFIGLINAPIGELQKQFAAIAKFNSLYSLLQAFVLLDNKYTNYYLTTIQNAFALLGMEICYGVAGPVDIQINGCSLTEQLFTRISRIMLLATCLKKQSDFIDDPELLAYQEKINRIKQQNAPIKGGNNNFNDAFIILTYEFGYKPEEILNMTQYTVNLILSYTNKSIRYKTTLIAAGNGNTKKVKFITDKGSK